ncbi:apelin receptor a [Limosa lapponica baueri]|uniref:Apelin receptor a n=1 Tax=Limosa lapponica baueri TaxID=1758121 RepID=A0A2I0T9N9_LIMLA|nr:apelin receptor a [Limosa lapponica baueri]
MEYGEAEEHCYGEETTGNGTGEACGRQADWEAFFSLLLYLLVFALGLSGNELVPLTVRRGPRARRRSADADIGNLALADLAFVATLPLWAAYTALRPHWPFGAAPCELGSLPVLPSPSAGQHYLTNGMTKKCQIPPIPPSNQCLPLPKPCVYRAVDFSFPLKCPQTRTSRGQGSHRHGSRLHGGNVKPLRKG